MSKSILIINTPENCSHCNQCWKKNVSKNKYIYFCGNKVFHEGKDVEEYNVDPEDTKPDWCPLSPLPEKIGLHKSIGKAAFDNNIATMMARQYEQGYNNCLDNILKGENK